MKEELSMDCMHYNVCTTVNNDSIIWLSICLSSNVYFDLLVFKVLDSGARLCNRFLKYKKFEIFQFEILEH